MNGITQGIVSLLQNWQGTLGFELKTCNHELFNIQMPLYRLQLMTAGLINNQDNVLKTCPSRNGKLCFGWDNFIFKQALRIFHLLKAFFCSQWKCKAYLTKFGNCRMVLKLGCRARWWTEGKSGGGKKCRRGYPFQVTSTEGWPVHCKQAVI